MNCRGLSLTFVLWDGDEEHEYEIPAKMEVCARCRGTGKHTNPNIDGNGLTAEDFAEDPDFEEAYFRGDYDVRCSACFGCNVVRAPDFSAASFSIKRKYVRYLKQQQEWERESYAERQMARREDGYYG